MRILYLEDNAIDADLTRRELARGKSPHELEVVTTLAEAWAKILGSNDAPFDLALVDLDLPDGSGIELVLGLRERDLPIAAVMLTGSGDERSAVAALKAGADDYLVKSGDHLRVLPEVIESARAAFGVGRARRTRPLHVLYAEHSEADIDLVKRHLARHSPHIIIEAVESAEEVLARLTSTESVPDVLLLDYRLRGLDGLELMALLQARELLTMPVVLVTGQGDEAVAVRALRRGAAEYLVKRPGYLHELTATLENTHHRALLWREQAALRASEARFRQLAEHIDEVFWIAAPDNSRVEYVSPAYAKVWGRSCDSLLENPADWMDSIVPEDRVRVDAWQDASLKAGGCVVDYRIQRPDGQVRWVRDRASPVRDAVGTVFRVVGVAEDITERRHLEDQLRHSQKMEAIGQLSGGVAHDFNNLLTIIQGHIGLLQISGNMTESIEASIEQIAQATTRASNLTRQLLTFSRKQVLQSRDLDLRTVLGDLAKMLQRIVGEDIKLRVMLGDVALMVHADPGMMEQILMNLTVNARDAMPRGGSLTLTLGAVPVADVPLAELNLEVRQAGDNAELGYARLVVEDTGEGIPSEILPRIFEPFFTTKPIGKGTGLGLATVYGIVRQHQGGIRVCKTSREGTVFEVYLPLTSSQILEGERDASASPFPGTGASAAGARILLVEDDASVSAMVSMALSWVGYHVLLATNGPEALRLWAAHQDEIDLLLTDYVMPEGMSGRELAEQILAMRPGLPVVYMSGYSQEMSGSANGALEMDDFLPKPFGVEALHRAVAHALKRGRRSGS